MMCLKSSLETPTTETPTTETPTTETPTTETPTVSAAGAVIAGVFRVSIVGALLAVGLAGGRAQTAPPPVPAAGQVAAVDKLTGLSVRVSTNKKTYATGEPIKMTLIVRNNTRADLHLIFNSSQRFDFEIRRGAKPEGPALWQWSRGMMFSMMMTPETLKAGATQAFAATYDLKANGNGKPEPLPPGIYNVTGALAVGRAPDRPHGMATFRIK